MSLDSKMIFATMAIFKRRMRRTSFKVSVSLTMPAVQDLEVGLDLMDKR